MHIWDQFLGALEQDLGPQIVQKWLKPLQLVRFDAGNLYLEADDPFQANWFEEHIRAKALSTLKTSSGKPFKIHMQVKKKVPFPEPSSPAASSLFSLDPLTHELSFEHFIVTDANLLTFRLLAELVHFDPSTGTFKDPSPIPLQYNPLFLYGEAGSGKTHLLCATALAMQKQKKQVLYVKAETFTEHMIKAIRQSQMMAFRAAYRQSDVLIVDNIEHFANKMATQEEFFHTFNHYHMSGKQLILSSKVAPNKLQGIESRLVSRFEWGVTLHLHSLPQDKLPLLLLKKLKLYDLALTPDVSKYLLGMFTTPATLTKALETLSYKTHMDPKTPLSIHIAKAITQTLSDEVLGKNLSTEKILTALSECFSITPQEILAKGQTKEIVLPRQLSMYLLRHKLKMPYPKIGKVFDKDHSTVMSSVKIIENALQNKEPRLIQAIETIEKKLANS